MASCNQPSTSCTNSVTTTDGGPISEPRALPMVAVFLPKSKDTGGDKVPPAQWTHLLSGHFEFEFVRGKDVAAGVLTTHKYACFIVGGGLGPQHATEMQKLIGKNKVISYVESGGSYLGLCAGAYVGLNYKPSSEWWTWGLVDASVFDMFNWNRGFGTAKVKLTPAGIKTFPSLTAAARTVIPQQEQQTTQPDEPPTIGIPPPPPPPPPPAFDLSVVDLLYANGPLIQCHNTPHRNSASHNSGTIVFGEFNNEIRKNSEIPKGVMLGTPAIVGAQRGKGRVMVFSPHPESTGTERAKSLLIDALMWLTHQT